MEKELLRQFEELLREKDKEAKVKKTEHEVMVDYVR